MNKFIAIVLFFALVMPLKVYSQDCTIKFDYSVQKEGELYSLSLKNELTSGSYELKLYDLNKGEVVEIKNLEFKSSENKLAFSNIVPGRYTVYIKEKICNTTRTLGGPTGIDLTSE